MLNKGIGFVNERNSGPDALSFTRYGSIEGKLVVVSEDAATDEQLGLNVRAVCDFKDRYCFSMKRR